MGNTLKLTNRFLSFVTHLAASSVLAKIAVGIVALPSQAASLGFSQATLNFNGFSHAPQASQSIATDAAVNASSNYSGIEPNQAQVIGNFLVEEGQDFSFGFNANLGLQTSVDDLATETATTKGSVGFFLVDTANPQVIYDHFVVFGNLTTPGTKDYLSFNKSDSVTVTGGSNTDFEEPQELAAINAFGSYKRNFANSTSVTLIEANNSDKGSVAVPEATNTLGSLLFLGLTTMMYQARKKALRAR